MLFLLILKINNGLLISNKNIIINLYFHMFKLQKVYSYKMSLTNLFTNIDNNQILFFIVILNYFSISFIDSSIVGLFHNKPVLHAPALKISLILSFLCLIRYKRFLS